MWQVTKTLLHVALHRNNHFHVSSPCQLAAGTAYSVYCVDYGADDREIVVPFQSGARDFPFF